MGGAPAGTMVEPAAGGLAGESGDGGGAGADWAGADA